MPKVLDSFDFSRNKALRKYDLSACAKSPILFVRGEDYQCKDVSFVAIAHQRAKDAKLIAKTQIVDNGVVIQFFPKEKP